MTPRETYLIEDRKLMRAEVAERVRIGTKGFARLKAYDAILRQRRDLAVDYAGAEDRRTAYLESQNRRLQLENAALKRGGHV